MKVQSNVVNTIFYFIFLNVFLVDAFCHKSLFLLSETEAPATYEWLTKNNIHNEEDLVRILDQVTKEERWNFYAKTFKDILGSEKTGIRQKLVESLVGGLEQDTWQFNLKWLKQLESTDFSESAKKTIVEWKGPQHLDPSYIGLLGIAGIHEYGDEIAELAKEPIIEPLVGKWYNSKEWAAQLYMARNDNHASLRYVIERVGDHENIDERYQTLVKHLSYTRQAEAVDALIEMLFFDQEAPHSGGRELNPPIAAYVAFELSKLLIDFPVKKNALSLYNKSDVKFVRSWATNYEGPWKIKGKWKPQEQSVQETPEKEDSVSKVIEEEPEPESVAQKSKPEEPKQIELSEPESESSNWLLWIILLTVLIGVIAIVSRKRQ